MLNDIFQAFIETILIVSISGMLTFIIGVILSIFLATIYLKNSNLLTAKLIKNTLNKIEEAYEYLPFIAVLLILYPATKKLSSGQELFFAIAPLTLFCVPLFIAKSFSYIVNMPQNLQDIFSFYTSNKYKMITKVYLSECINDILKLFFQILTALVGYSTIVGFVGAPGLGRLLYTKGFETFNMGYLIVTTLCIAGAIKLLLVTEKALTINK